MHNTEKSVKDISLRAKDIILAVAHSCKSATTDVNAQLEDDLKQLTKYVPRVLHAVVVLISCRQHHECNSAVRSRAHIPKQVQETSLQVPRRS